MYKESFDSVFLVTKISLLKVEFFLKEQLSSISSRLCSDNQFFNVAMILTNMEAFTEDLRQQGKAKYVKQSLVLAEELAN